MESKIEKLKNSMYSTISNMRNEESVVAEFLNISENHKALKKIVQASKDSKNGTFGAYSVFQTYYQLDSRYEYVINNLEKAKTFNELFKMLSLPKSTLDIPNRGNILTFLCITGLLSQKSNATYYNTWLAFDIRLFAGENLYFIDFNGLEEAVNNSKKVT